VKKFFKNPFFLPTLFGYAVVDGEEYDKLRLEAGAGRNAVESYKRLLQEISELQGLLADARSQLADSKTDDKKKKHPGRKP
jgi:hypothetical protein